jgi:hypothetical protein
MTKHQSEPNAQPASEPATCAVCPWCDYRLPLPSEDYRCCPRCYGSFSFRKPVECGRVRCLEAKPVTDGYPIPHHRRRMVVCSICGNKRCPKAEYHGYACSGSNDTAQTPVIAAQPPASEPSGREESLNSLEARLAADIRAIDGNHDKGAAELAEQLIARGWHPAPRGVQDGEGELPSVIANRESAVRFLSAKIAAIEAERDTLKKSRDDLAEAVKLYRKAADDAGCPPGASPYHWLTMILAELNGADQACNILRAAYDNVVGGKASSADILLGAMQHAAALEASHASLQAKLDAVAEASRKASDRYWNGGLLEPVMRDLRAALAE